MIYRSFLFSMALVLPAIGACTETSDGEFERGADIGPSADSIGVEMVHGLPAAANRVIVRYRAGTAATQRRAVARSAATVAARSVGAPDSDTYMMHSGHKDVATLIAELSAEPSVLYAEPNYLVHTMDIPNDPRFGELWGLNNTGQTADGQVGTVDADIDAVEAWGVSTGSASVVVGVVDTGIDYNHPDLAANVWSAPSAFTVTLAGQTLSCPAGSHGVRSLATFSGVALTCDPMDDMTGIQCVGTSCFYGKHGTHVSGTIGARGNDGQGVAGINWTTSIIGLKFLSFTGGGTIEDAINVIEFAIQVKQKGLANIRVLNNSWGGSGFSQALLDMINKANTAGILFVAAAGNANVDNDVTPVSPGGLTAPNSVNVAATDNRDGKASFSSFGHTTVHLGAPGVAILSTVGNGGQAHFAYNGTSMATPHVAGSAALILAGCPGLDTAGLKATILNNVDPVPSMAGITITGGRLNVNRAIRACSGPFFVTASPGLRNVGRNTTTTYAVTVGVSGGFAGTVNLTVGGLPSGTTASVSPSSITGGGNATLSVTTGASTPLGSYTLAIKGTSGTTQSSAGVTLEVADPDFPMSASPSARLIQPGTGTTYAVDLGSKGSFHSVVTLSASGLPAGATASFSPSSVTAPGASTLTVNTGAATPEGLFTVTVKGIGGGLTRTTTVTLEVRKPTFSFTGVPASASVKRGFALPLLMSVTGAFGFSGTVGFSVSALPSGVTASIPSPATITPAQPFSGAKSSVMQTSTTTAVGTYSVTYTASGGGVTKTLPMTLTIQP